MWSWYTTTLTSNWELEQVVRVRPAAPWVFLTRNTCCLYAVQFYDLYTNVKRVAFTVILTLLLQGLNIFSPTRAEAHGMLILPTFLYSHITMYMHRVKDMPCTMFDMHQSYITFAIDTVSCIFVHWVKIDHYDIVSGLRQVFLWNNYNYLALTVQVIVIASTCILQYVEDACLFLLASHLVFSFPFSCDSTVWTGAVQCWGGGWICHSGSCAG